MEEFPKPPSLSYARRLWFHGLLVGLGLAGLILGAWFWLSGPSREEEAKVAPVPGTEAATPEWPAAGETAPAADSRALQVRLEEVMERLREATLKKDLPGFLSLYADAFPDLEDKRRRIARTWQTYDYLKMSFRLAEVRAQGPDAASALVTWQTETRDRRTRRIREVNRTYRATFAWESGQWRIASLEPEG